MSAPKSNPMIRALEFVVAMLLAAMAVIVFANAILRYAFSSGLIGAEDISRFLFIWLTYIGFVVVTAQAAHLRVDIILHWFSRPGRIVLGTVSFILIIFALLMFVIGCWQQMLLNNDIMAMGAIAYPLSWNYAAGVFAGAVSLVIVGASFVRLVRGDMSEVDCSVNAEIVEETLHLSKLQNEVEETK